MTCTSRSCRLECMKDNCKMTCHGAGYPSGCYPRCRGKGCQMDVHSTSGEPICEKGSCNVRFSKNTSGMLACFPGSCTFTCAKGQNCAFIGSCPNCTGPIYVDDPFATSNASVVCKVTILFYLYGVFIAFFILFV